MSKGVPKNKANFREVLERLAREVRDQAHHAAVCAPLHQQSPEDAIEKIDLDFFVEEALNRVD